MRFIFVLIGLFVLLEVTPSICGGLSFAMEKRFSKNSGNRLRRRSGGKSIPLLGNYSLLAEYYVELQVGDPPQRFTLQVDTGSTDMGIPMEGCNCGKHEDQYWAPDSADSSANKISCSPPDNIQCDRCRMKQCFYEIGYADGSGYSALLYNDTVRIGPLKADSVFIGAITSEVGGEFEPYLVDGILGFAQPWISEVNAPSLFQQIVDQSNGECEAVFSMCGDLKGGVLTLCGVGDFYSGDVEYTPMVNYEDGFYNIRMKDLLVGGQSVGVPARVYNDYPGTCVDSGTTISYLPSSALQGIMTLLQKNCSLSNLHGICDVPKGETLFEGYCYPMTPTQLHQFPDITIVAGKRKQRINIVLPPSSYLVPGFCENYDAYSLAVDDNGDSGVLLGDPVMIANLVVYDIANQRMGFAPKRNCHL